VADYCFPCAGQHAAIILLCFLVFVDFRWNFYPDDNGTYFMQRMCFLFAVELLYTVRVIDYHVRTSGLVDSHILFIAWMCLEHLGSRIFTRESLTAATTTKSEN
jgi:hypothetical protein